MSQFSDLRDAVDALEEDFTKFYDKGNKAAGTRIRQIAKKRGSLLDTRIYKG